jgi:hypothetical protein
MCPPMGQVVFRFVLCCSIQLGVWMQLNFLRTVVFILLRGPEIFFATNPSKLLQCSIGVHDLGVSWGDGGEGEGKEMGLHLVSLEPSDFVLSCLHLFR